MGRLKGLVQDIPKQSSIWTLFYPIDHPHASNNHVFFLSRSFYKAKANVHVKLSNLKANIKIPHAISIRKTAKNSSCKPVVCVFKLNHQECWFRPEEETGCAHARLFANLGPDCPVHPMAHQQLPCWSMAIKCLRAPLWNKPKYRIGFESQLIRENPTLFHIPTFQWWYVSHSILPVYYPIFEIPLHPHMLVGCLYHSPPLGDWISSKPWEAITDISPLMPGNCGKEGGCSGCTRQGKIRRKLP